MIKVSKILNSKIHPFILGALISRIIQTDDLKYFATLSSYQKSKVISDSEFDFDAYTEVYVKELNNISKSSDWISINEFNSNFKHCAFSLRGKEKALFIIENDLFITKESFYNQLYSKVFNDSEYIKDVYLNEDKKNFIRGFCELRGSIDTTRPLLAMDLFYDSIFELNKTRLLYEYFSVPYEVLNINFRELQAQFVSAENHRNTQFRIELSWYMNNIGLINKYKTEIVKKSYFYNQINTFEDVNYVLMPEKAHRSTGLFIDRLSYFSSRIFGKQLTSKNIEELRNELEFDIDKIPSTAIPRNKDLVNLVRLFTDDICLGCHKQYNVTDRTFIHRKTGRPYFEIHHNISLANNLELDHEDNLVKLCPVCHTSLKSGIGTPEHQKSIIASIIDNSSNVRDFSSHFFNTQDSNVIVENIFKCLK